MSVKTVVTEIALCSECSGLGRRVTHELVSRHGDREYSKRYGPCLRCVGSGRVVVKITREESPYKEQQE